MVRIVLRKVDRKPAQLPIDTLSFEIAFKIWHPNLTVTRFIFFDPALKICVINLIFVSRAWVSRYFRHCTNMLPAVTTGLWLCSECDKHALLLHHRYQDRGRFKSLNNVRIRVWPTKTWNSCQSVLKWLLAIAHFCCFPNEKANQMWFESGLSWN